MDGELKWRCQVENHAGAVEVLLCGEGMGVTAVEDMAAAGDAQGTTPSSCLCLVTRMIRFLECFPHPSELTDAFSL